MNMVLQVKTDNQTTPVVIERGVLARSGEYARLSGRRVCIVTDSGVPEQYVRAVRQQCERASVFCFETGEQNKSLETYRALLSHLIEQGFDRKDAVFSVGGGVVTDLGGFAAATYMRGIECYSAPTTLLSQVDASVGGKTGVDVNGYKNMVGAFWQPSAVLIDPLTLATLPRRRISDGLSEIIKMALTSDAALFEKLERTELLGSASDTGYEVPSALDGIIEAAVRIKADVVRADEREAGPRRVLNFGHTIGHAIESCSGLGERTHGECVALGMLPMCAEDVRERLVQLLRRSGLPHTLVGLPPEEQLQRAMGHDKKAQGESVHAVFVDKVGEFLMRRVTPQELMARLADAQKTMDK